ncbi:MAG TPA: F0F1 ATP synthase subunit delta [Candidatus Microsaccharimonas sp.]|nr:F0F1 ATP synthase subunit delta [Candidatus Microsaccharimonas sp.]
MKTPRTKIASVIADRTLKQGESKELAKEIAAYLLAEKRVGELESVLRDVQVDWAKSGYVEVLASTAHPLTADVKAQITDKVKQLYPEARQIVVTTVADPEVIGGVRLSLANQQLDLSVEAKLNKFKQLTAGKE